MIVRNLLIVLTIIIITWIAVFHCIRIDKQVTNVDYLESLANEIKLNAGPLNNLYFLSGSNSIELYYKTQLAFAPVVVIKNGYNEIPENSLILFVTDRNTEVENLEFEKIGTELPGLDSVSNEMYQFKLIRK